MKAVSLFEIFKIGIGPSSSHTVGPMIAARHFALCVLKDHLSEIQGLKVHLHGSLSLTGKGHGTDRAIICGLEGYAPCSIEPEIFESALRRIDNNKFLTLACQTQIAGGSTELIKFHQDSLALHPNGMRFVASSANQTWDCCYYSIGGGFVNDSEGTPLALDKQLLGPLPLEFHSGDELLSICSTENKSIAEVVLANELTARSLDEIQSGSLSIWQAMDSSINRGLHLKGELPGGLKVTRRAAQMFQDLEKRKSKSALSQLDYLSCYALAVNEENASYGRVVTAPTNGAAGIIPAVFKFYLSHLDGTPDRLLEYLLTATAIANLFKAGASLSAAEMGCQGEIGVASSMAAAGLTALQGGTAMQIENAAEIAIEHSLGLTCDPIGGLVQIPCIERNAIGAAKAITASQLALKSDGKHIVSLDQAISAMKKTGDDMHSKYKETSKGGLAISVAASEC